MTPATGQRSGRQLAINTSNLGDAVLTSLRLGAREPIETALKRNNWNRQATAAELNINRTTLYKKMRKYRLDVGETN